MTLTLIALMSALPVMAQSAAAEPASQAPLPADTPVVEPVPAEEVVAEPAVSPETVSAPEQPEVVPAPEPEAPSVSEQPEVPAPEPSPAPAPQPEPAPAPVVQSEPAPAPVPPAPAVDLAAAYRGIVKVEVVSRTPDYETPWQSGNFGRGNGTGFLVAPGLFMTNAHVVANAVKIDISLYADARRIPARVKYVAHDADLALLEIADTSAFEGVPCLEFTEELPQLEDTVRAIGYPVGGNRLSVTRGIVSRIDTIPYAHPRNIAHMALQVDAAINPGNSGGPVLKGDKVVGVAFQGLLQANSTGYVIPMPVIRHFLEDVKDGRYDGYVEMGAYFIPMENEAMRRHFEMPDNGLGCLVSDVVKGSACDGALQPGDVVIAVNGLPVDCTAMIDLDGVRVRLEELAERSFAGDKVHFTIIRDGQVQETEVTLAPLPSVRVLSRRYDENPRYVVYAGLVFQPLELNVVQAHQVSSSDVMVELDRFTRGGESREKDDLVLLTRQLPDEVNTRLTNMGRSLVTRVNGVEVKGLAHLHSLLYPAEGEERPAYTVIELADAPRPLVIDNAAVDAANSRIAERYNIPAAARLK